MLKPIFAWPGVGILLISRAVALDLYVSPNGNDGNDGSANAPWQTIAHARDQVRALVPGMTGDIHVWLGDGIYSLSGPLTFDARDGGGNQFDVSYEALPGAKPRLSGGRPITGWKLADASKNVWSAPAVGIETRQLYVNGVRATRARSDGNPISGAKQTDVGYTIAGTPALAAWKNLDQAEFVYNGQHGGLQGTAQWVEPRMDVQSVRVENGQTTIVMKQPVYAMLMKVNPQSRPGLPSYAENAYELLSHPGDWYLDQKGGQIYYIPRVGEDLAQAEVIAPTLEVLVSGSGTVAASLRHLQFKGITFEYATWMQPSGDRGFPEIQAGFLAGNSYTPGNIAFSHAEHLRFEDCLFIHLGATGLELSHGVQDTVVTGCRFEDISGSGLLQGSVSDPLRSDTRLREDGNTIQNCSLDHVGQEFHGAPGLLNGYVSHTLISHNEISHVPYTGISIGWGWGAKSYAANNRIVGNKVESFMELLGDGGAFYALSPQPNSELSGNWFRHQATNQAGAAIYPDEGSAGWDIHDNVVEDVYRWLQIWTPSIHDIAVHDNFTTTENLINKGTYITLTNNPVLQDPLPPPAQKITAAAGPVTK